MYDFLNKQDQKGMKVFRYLYANGSTTLKEVAEAVNIVTPTVSKIISDVTKDNKALSKQVFEKKGDIIVNNLDLNAVLNHYLKDSILYEMINSLVYTGKISRDDFENRLFISQSTFSRNRARLKEILNKFKLDLNNRNEIEGSEYVIRKFFYFFYTNTSGYTKVDEDDFNTKLHFLFKAAPFLRNNNHGSYFKMYRLLKISTLRITQGYYMDKEIHVNSELFPIISNLKENMPEYITQKQLPEEVKNKEINFFIYALYREYITDYNLSHEELVELFRIPDPEFYSVEKKIVDSIINEISFKGEISKDVKGEVDELVNRYHLEMMYGLIDRIFFEVVSSKEEVLNGVEQQLLEEADQIYEKLKNNAEYSAWVRKNDIAPDKYIFTTNLFFFIYKAKIFNAKANKSLLNANKIKLFIQMTHPEIERLVQTKFELLFWNRIYFVNDVSQKPDFIIADIDYPEYEGFKTHFLASIPTEEQTEKIMHEVSKNILNEFLKKMV
ncbi:hypothetical protein RD055328_11300 [Companilactobacillus sp. RD055328]|uniref:helix-turn-helix domain-containing protein n=1 Tax=Companilactobacillus sp. RD055328 TaxID=2916634 RepID=UPI001FC89757|nr:helix-turn-helix domain-containing protein [Companilactobacillus sp. RD055328]GKQ43207.1 hypothetical protein RD055328_11300 [Companilactobacillus sp. RD055328]